MAFLRQCLQLQRLHQGHDAFENALMTEDMVDALKVIAESHEMNSVQDEQALSGPVIAIDCREK